MIKNSLIVFSIIFGGWSIILAAIETSTTQSMWQNNVVIAEKYLFDANNIDNIIVGSSLANELPMAELPNFYNLSLSAQGVVDGLEVIKLSQKLPKNIFIEINFFEREENKIFASIISSPLNPLKKYIPALQTDKQPLPSLIDLVRGDPEVETLQSQEPKLDNALFEKLLEGQKISYLADQDPEALNDQVTLLNKYVAYFKSKGVNIIFFEMPVHKTLVDLGRAPRNRNIIKTSFPNDDFIELPLNVNSYTTDDGIHLTEEEALVYINYFKSEISAINQ